VNAERLALALLLVAAAGCNPTPQHEPGASATPLASPTGLPPLDITGHGSRTQPVRITDQSGNRKIYELLARSYVSHSAQSIAQATFQQTAVTFFDKDGTRLQARAPTAEVNDRTKQVILSGGVHARTSTGLNLTCDRLTYDQTTALLHGYGNVRITGAQGGQNELLTGNTLTSNVKLTQMVVK
jgi:LPS export ABC transporter protein LptC